MPTIGKLEKLIALIKTLPELPIHFDFDSLSDDCEWTVEPVTVSCDDTTVVGYVITNQDTVN